MKIICGFDLSYERCLALTGLERLLVRRQRLAEKFVTKAALNPAFGHWFPLSHDVPYSLRAKKKFAEVLTRTERLRASPIYFYRRLLNFLDSEQ